eukprot:6194298-Pleurochrysis_carterae.AAC.3
MKPIQAGRTFEEGGAALQLPAMRRNNAIQPYKRSTADPLQTPSRYNCKYRTATEASTAVLIHRLAAAFSEKKHARRQSALAYQPYRRRVVLRSRGAARSWILAALLGFCSLPVDVVHGAAVAGR